MADEPAEPPTISLATMERVASISAADAVAMQLQAEKHRRVADHLEAEGDRVGPRFERAEAKRLERTAELALDPLMHTTGPLTVGAGGEVAVGIKAMRPYIDTVRERPDMLAIDASRQRMELADKAGALTLAIDAAATIEAANSLEKMLLQEMAAAHTMAMEAQAEARELLRTYKRTGYIHQQLSIGGWAATERIGANRAGDCTAARPERRGEIAFLRSALLGWAMRCIRPAGAPLIIYPERQVRIRCPKE
jgi:hypothetical protein